MRVQSHFMFLLVLVLFSVAGVWRLSSLPDLQVFGEIKSQAMISEKVVALTFDDGPTPDKTNQILQILAAEEVPATFFETPPNDIRFFFVHAFHEPAHRHHPGRSVWDRP